LRLAFVSIFVCIFCLLTKKKYNNRKRNKSLGISNCFNTFGSGYLTRNSFSTNLRSNSNSRFFSESYNCRFFWLAPFARSSSSTEYPCHLCCCSSNYYYVYLLQKMIITWQYCRYCSRLCSSSCFDFESCCILACETASPCSVIRSRRALCSTVYSNCNVGIFENFSFSIKM